MSASADDRTPLARRSSIRRLCCSAGVPESKSQPRRKRARPCSRGSGRAGWGWDAIEVEKDRMLARQRPRQTSSSKESEPNLEREIDALAEPPRRELSRFTCPASKALQTWSQCRGLWCRAVLASCDFDHSFRWQSNVRPKTPVHMPLYRSTADKCRRAGSVKRRDNYQARNLSR